MPYFLPGLEPRNLPANCYVGLLGPVQVDQTPVEALTFVLKSVLLGNYSGSCYLEKEYLNFFGLKMC